MILMHCKLLTNLVLTLKENHTLSSENVYHGRGIVRMSTSVAGAAAAGSERCLMVARISCRFDGSAMSASGTTDGGVMGREGE